MPEERGQEVEEEKRREERMSVWSSPMAFVVFVAFGLFAAAQIANISLPPLVLSGRIHCPLSPEVFTLY